MYKMKIKKKKTQKMPQKEARERYQNLSEKERRKLL